MTATFQSVDLHSLRVGATLRAPIFGRGDNVKLLGERVPITPELIERLQGRGVTSVIVLGSDVARLEAFRPQGIARYALEPHAFERSRRESDVTRDLESRLEDLTSVAIAGDPEPLLNSVTKKTGTYDADQMEEAVEHNEHAVAFIEDVFQQLDESRSPELEPLEEIWRDAFIKSLEDIDLFVCLGVTPFSADYPARHCLHTAKTAVAIGAMLGLGRQSLHELALGCLVHDLGMLQFDQRILTRNRRLVRFELRRLADHPIHSLELLEPRLGTFPVASQCVAFQLHERCNGSGYPRGVTAEAIHPLAKIAAVADTFVALVAERPYRKGLQPYFAMETMLQKVHEGLYDAAVVRALLRAVSLFPIGSYVKLSDGRVGRVIRSNGERFDRPVVEAWHEERSYIPRSAVDLLSEPELRVVAPLPRLTSA
jgi:HD-GYP domain-containing protein (c-di-GMP phosphodiesterase class II)